MIFCFTSAQWSDRAQATAAGFFRPRHDDYMSLDGLSTARPLRRPPRRNLGDIPRVRWQSCARCLFYISGLPLIAICLFVIKIFLEGIPPTYDNIREYERSLPQHNISLPYPEGKYGRYVRFPGRDTGHGLNNHLQEIYFMAHIAHLSNRAFVFEEYTWSHSPLPYTLQGLAMIPSRIPINAFVSGPVSGGNIQALSPRAISARWWWNIVCPAHKRVIVDPRGAPESGDGQEVMEWWVQTLSSIPDGCVEVDRSTLPFHPLLFASSRILSAWPSMENSPVLTHHSWSPLVQAAVKENLRIISPSTHTSNDSYVHGLLAMHLRRGDFDRHCRYLAANNFGYTGHNQLPGMTDHFNISHVPAAARLDYYKSHCWPDVDAIVAKAAQVRRGTPLSDIYLLTNGRPSWVKEVRECLLRDGWSSVKTTLDIKLTTEQHYVSGAVDMAIAERAQVFIGNGFSSLTSNVVMFRLLKGLAMDSNRLW